MATNGKAKGRRIEVKAHRGPDAPRVLVADYRDSPYIFTGGGGPIRYYELGNGWGPTFRLSGRGLTPEEALRAVPSLVWPIDQSESDGRSDLTLYEGDTLRGLVLNAWGHEGYYGGRPLLLLIEVAEEQTRITPLAPDERRPVPEVRCTGAIISGVIEDKDA